MGRVAIWGGLVVFVALVMVPAHGSASHWSVTVSFDPTTVPMETTQVFSLTVRNDGPDPVAVSQLRVTFDWVTSGYGYTVSNSVVNIAPANDHTYSVSVDIPRLVKDSVHTVTITVTARTNGDLFAEDKQYTGHVTAVESVLPAGISSVPTFLLVTFVIVGVIAAAGAIALSRRKRIVPPGGYPPPVR